MVFFEDIIPIYINQNLINNLFTVIVQEYKQKYVTKSRSEQVLTINTPLGNILKGRYIQGNFGLNVANEYTTQITEEWISIIIEIFLETRNLLQEKKVLKTINNGIDVKNINENDYIEIKCNLKKSPQIRNLENLINYLGMKQITSYGKENNTKLIDLLQGYLDQYKNSRCLKCVTDPIYGTNVRMVIPILLKYMEDNVDYLNSLDVTILGKVLKVSDENNSRYVDLMSNTYYDYLDDDNFKKFKDIYLKNSKLENKCSNKIIDEKCPIIEVLPLGMYI